MKEYYGTKRIAAKPMTRIEYNKFRGWELPSNESAEDEGYLVEYLDGGKPNIEGFTGYVSWSPKEQFDSAYQQTTSMSFGHAIVALKSGDKVARAGWNGKGMWLYLVPANGYPAETNAGKEYWRGKGGNAIETPAPVVPFGAYILMKTAQENLVPWLASQTDVLADDWMIIS